PCTFATAKQACFERSPPRPDTTNGSPGSRFLLPALRAVCIVLFRHAQFTPKALSWRLVQNRMSVQLNNASPELPCKVLIVDDDLDIRTLLAEYLQDNGCEPLLAADGPAMWQTLANHPVDLIVLDLNLPGVDGLAL